MGVHTAGNKYGLDENLYFSFPVECANGNYYVVNDIPLDDWC